MRKCNRVKGCKNTKKTAKKPRYCRKKHNKHLKQKGGRRTRRHSHIKTHNPPMTAKVTDVHGEWHSVDMPSVSPSMRKEIEEECREKCHGRNRKECRDRCRRRLLDRAVEAQFGGKSLDCMAICMEEQKNKRPRPSKVRALRECRENCHQGRGLKEVYEAAEREGILEPQNENQ